MTEGSATLRRKGDRLVLSETRERRPIRRVRCPYHVLFFKVNADWFRKAFSQGLFKAEDMGCKKVDLRTYLIVIKPLSMHPNLLDDLLKYQLLVPTLVWSCWGRGDLAFLTSSQVIAMLLACRDHFENHCPKINPLGSQARW